MIRHRFTVIVPVVLLALAAAGCSGDDATPTTTVAQDDVVFGQGSVPETVPDDFPVPAQAVIGSTLILRSAGKTEMIVRLPAAVAAAVAYYEDNLAARGYTVSESAGNENDWQMVFARDGLSGTIDFSLAGVDLTQAVVVLEQ